MIILSVAAAYISTSKFSVGEAQPNVFFSAWTNLVSVIVNREIWRKGRNHRSFDNIPSGKKRHWFLCAIWSTIACVSTIDFFLFNNIIPNSNHYECINLSWSNKWIWLSLGIAIICWAIVLVHRYYKPVLLVHVVEVIVSLAIIGVDGYFVIQFTEGGEMDHVSCPSNLYFSVWGTFLTSVWIFGTIVQRSRSLVNDD